MKRTMQRRRPWRYGQRRLSSLQSFFRSVERIERAGMRTQLESMEDRAMVQHRHRRIADDTTPRKVTGKWR